MLMENLCRKEAKLRFHRALHELIDGYKRRKKAKLKWRQSESNFHELHRKASDEQCEHIWMSEWAQKYSTRDAACNKVIHLWQLNRASLSSNEAEWVSFLCRVDDLRLRVRDKLNYHFPPACAWDYEQMEREQLEFELDKLGDLRLSRWSHMQWESGHSVKRVTKCRQHDTAADSIVFHDEKRLFASSQVNTLWCSTFPLTPRRRQLESNDEKLFCGLNCVFICERLLLCLGNISSVLGVQIAPKRADIRPRMLEIGFYDSKNAKTFFLVFASLIQRTISYDESTKQA